MKIPQDVKRILRTLEEAGYEAYAVGGCVRDACLGREPGDWDITTNALPEQIKGLFRRTVDTGIQHGTVTVMLGPEGYEITTYRLDGQYSDGRHPDSVTFTPELSEDLKRRDFTINAMACGADGEIVDLFEGKKDLEDGLIRCVGEPAERFQEDALRILRALRFSAQLHFRIEEKTWEALKQLAPNLRHVSRERILAELNKMLLSDHPEKMELLFSSGTDAWIGADLSDLRPDRRIADLPARKDIRWAAAFSGGDPEQVRTFLKLLKSDNDTSAGAALLVRELQRPMPPDLPGTRRLLSAIGKERAEDLVLLLRAGFGPESRKDEAERLEELKDQVIGSGCCLDLKELALSGRDLIRMGVHPGPQLGRILQMLLDNVLEHPEYNTEKKLTELAEAEMRGSCRTEEHSDET